MSEKAFPPMQEQTFGRRAYDGWQGSALIHGPCPGCDAWQLEVPWDVYVEKPYMELFWDIEEILREHMFECPGLMEIADSRGIKY